MKKSALKKLAAFAAAGVLAAGVLAGCAGSGSNSGSDDKTIGIETSGAAFEAVRGAVFPQEEPRQVRDTPFFETRSSSFEPTFLQQAAAPSPAEMYGRLDVRFAGAPEGMRLERANSSKSLTLNTSTDYDQGSGRSTYAPAW